MKIFIKLLLITYLDSTFSFPAKLKHEYESIRNREIFDGDIVLKPRKGKDKDDYFNALPNDNQLWPHGIIYYEIDPELRGIKTLIESAFKQFHDKTCIRFQRRRSEDNYVYIHNSDNNQCQSMVGLAGGRQEVDLGFSCHYIGTILHELMHVIGFYHEHSRSDRDKYLDIHLENVIEGKEKNFKILESNENRILEEHFDYQSVMIYGEMTYSKNGYPTMMAKNGEKLTDPYFKHSLTPFNIRSIKKLYHC